MYFTTFFQAALLIAATTVVALPSPLNTREAVCGVWYDDYLGPSSAGDVYGTGQCQQLKKSGEAPNDQSSYTFKMKGACIHCDFFSDEKCGQGTASVGNNRGDDWDHQWTYGIVKSFKC